MKKKPLIIVSVVVLVAILVTVQLVRDFERATEVEVERLRPRDLRSMVSASGWLRPHRQVDVSANTMGKVVELLVREGDRVLRGQVLLRIDPARYRGEVDQLRAALHRARADLQAAETSLSEARDTLAREEALAERGVSSRDRLDGARFEVERAEATVSSGQAQVRGQQAALGTAEHDLDQVTVVSELDGVITRLNVEEGENVVTGTMNNPGTVLLTISDLSEMETRLEVDETDVVNLALDQVAELTVDAYPDTVFGGVVTEIGHAPIRAAGRAGETSADFEVIVHLTQTLAGMRPGLSASADIVTATRDTVLSVSIGALVYRDPERERRAEERHRGGRASRSRAGAERDTAAAVTAAAVDSPAEPDDGEDDDDSTGNEVYGLFVIEGGRARFTPVEIGITGERHFEILAGIDAGTEVVAGSFRTLRELRSGDRVKPKKRNRQR